MNTAQQKVGSSKGGIKISRDQNLSKPKVDNQLRVNPVICPLKDSPSQVSISESGEELRAEATDPVRSVTPSRGNVKLDVKLTSDVKVAETKR